MLFISPILTPNLVHRGSRELCSLVSAMSAVGPCSGSLPLTEATAYRIGEGLLVLLEVRWVEGKGCLGWDF